MANERSHEPRTLMGKNAPSMTTGSMGRRAFVGRTAAAGAAAWVAPSILTSDRIAAATGSCTGGVSVCEFTSGLDGWTIDNSWGSGITGLWKHNTEASRGAGSLHYGRGTTGDYRTGNNRNSGRVRSPEFQIPLTGPNQVEFTVWREVESQDAGYDRLRLRIIGSSSQTLYSASSIGNTSGFETETWAIPASFNDQVVRFQFDFDTRDGLYNRHEGIYIGRFEVTACPPVVAAAPAILALRSATLRSEVDTEQLESPPPRR